jgi:hypothetical protein
MGPIHEALSWLERVANRADDGAIEPPILNRTAL